MSEKEQQTPPEHLQNITDRLKALKQQVPSVNRDSSSHGVAVGKLMWIAFNVTSDLIAGVLFGLGIGYGLDRWLGTRPVFIAVFLVLGCIAGLLNAVRFLKRYDERQREQENVPQTPKKE